MLLRSLLVAAISSKPYLLLPSLSILSFLCKPGRGFLLDVDRNPILHGILKSTFYKQFCAGETSDEVLSTIRHFKDMGFQGTIMTYAKETVFDHRTQAQHGLGTAQSAEKDSVADDFCPHIEDWRKGTMKTVELLREGDYLAVKLTGAGQSVTEAFAAKELPPSQMLDSLDEICTKCKEQGIRILVDGESQHFQWGILRVTLDLMRKYNRDGYALVYNTYQAYLKSTPDTLAKHLAVASEEGFTLGLKLVRGAYIATDERSLIHDTKQDTDDKYNNISQGALKQQIGEFGRNGGRHFPSVNLFLAGHNKASVLACHNLHQQRLEAKLPTVPVGYGQLHGMSDELSNLGTAILNSLLNTPDDNRDSIPFTRYIACIQSKSSEQRLASQFSGHSQKLVISIDDNAKAINEADVVILALDPSSISAALIQPDIRNALGNKLLISVAAGWTCQRIESMLYGDREESADKSTEGRAFVIRTLPNIAALVSQSLTAIEIEPGRTIPKKHFQLTDAIFARVGKIVHVPPSLMDATTAVAGSTPAMFSVIVEAMIDAAVAVGVPRILAHTMIFQAMQGTATMLQSGIHPALLKDQGTSPEGCTIGGVMTMEEAGVRGGVAKALREAVTIARLMGERHVNDTRE
ncbi:hypothetical protein ZTR_04291 [Talaromyces verruculosus]|nr:hypothetical protein ZTR_04291 [Talaromyces verruculosus]